MLKPFFKKDIVEAGIDEAGRGCFAGPVFAAAVILPLGFHHPLLNDSKLVSEKNRNLLRIVIEKESLSFAVAAVDNSVIDKINILQATFNAMHQALDRLQTTPGSLLVDGNRFRPYKNIPHLCIVEGDKKYASIAAASILAKTYRDDFMRSIHPKCPWYGWEDNKGYGTAAHRHAISEHGLSSWHRKSFNIGQD